MYFILTLPDNISLYSPNSSRTLYSNIVSDLTPCFSIANRLEYRAIEISNNKIKCFSFNKDEIIDFEIISRSNIKSSFSGPKIIVESTAITYVDVNYEVTKDSDNNLILNNKDMK